MAEELKACPFCGGSKIKKNSDDGQFWNTCQQCFADGPPTSKRSDEGAPDWNTRAQLPSQGGEAVSVVGIRISTDGFGSYIADSTIGIGPAFPGEVREPLMTVAQHNRIIAAITAHPATGVIVSRWQVWVGEAFYGAFQDVVLASDYDRLEQECKDAKCQAELIQRAAEVLREERDHHREMAGCMDLFRKDMIEAGVVGESCSPMFMTEGVLGYIGKLQAENDAAPSAKPIGSGCGSKLATGQYFIFCGETDMGQSMPALCENCGESFKAECP